MKFLRKLSLFIPLLFLAGCTPSKDAYEGRIIKDSDDLIATTEKYDYKSGDKLDISSINVTFKGSPIEYEYEASTLKSGVFFITKSNDTPSLSRVKQDSLTLKIQEEKRDQTFYVGYLESDEGSLFVSKSITVHITNDKAIKTWVYWVVGGVVVVVAVLLVYGTKKYKEKHP